MEVEGESEEPELGSEEISSQLLSPGLSGTADALLIVADAAIPATYIYTDSEQLNNVLIKLITKEKLTTNRFPFSVHDCL